MTIIDTRGLFQPLQEQYIQLLTGLGETDWNKNTLASHWTVKDIVSHLLDGDLRVLSMQRDQFFGVKPADGDDYGSIVDWLNQLNHEWVSTTKRLSPRVLVALTQTIAPVVSDYFEKLDLFGEAVFPVSWAGESKSLNWMHIAREYTERWHHQQQIREAVGADDRLLQRRFFHPMISTFMLGLPHHFRNYNAPPGTVVEVIIGSDAWYLVRAQHHWAFQSHFKKGVDSTVVIPKELSWKLFCKNIRPHQIPDQVQLRGDQEIGSKVLEMVAVMA